MSTRPTNRATFVRGTLAVLPVLLAAFGPAFAADPGDTGLQFLKIGVGARSAAMGEAYSAVAQDPTAVYWNPSGISSIIGRQYHASHNEWISDVRYEYLAAVQGMKGQAIGLHVGFLHMGELDGRNSLGDPTATFRAYDLTTGLTYGLRLFRSLEIGLTGKLLYEKIDSFSAFGLATDFGLRYRTPLRGLTLAATATNIGTSMKFEEESFVLPAQARMGAAYRTRSVLQGLLLAADLAMPNDGDVKALLGTELWVHEMVALRGGMKVNYDQEFGTTGFGLRYHDYRFDYAYVPFSDSVLGDTHRLSIDWHPGSYQR